MVYKLSQIILYSQGVSGILCIYAVSILGPIFVICIRIICLCSFYLRDPSRDMKRLDNWVLLETQKSKEERHLQKKKNFPLSQIFRSTFFLPQKQFVLPPGQICFTPNPPPKNLSLRPILFCHPLKISNWVCMCDGWLWREYWMLLCFILNFHHQHHHANHHHDNHHYHLGNHHYIVKEFSPPSHGQCHHTPSCYKSYDGLLWPVCIIQVGSISIAIFIISIRLSVISIRKRIISVRIISICITLYSIANWVLMFAQWALCIILSFSNLLVCPGRRRTHILGRQQQCNKYNVSTNYAKILTLIDSILTYYRVLEWKLTMRLYLIYSKHTFSASYLLFLGLGWGVTYTGRQNSQVLGWQGVGELLEWGEEWVAGD